MNYMLVIFFFYYLYFSCVIMRDYAREADFKMSLVWRINDSAVSGFGI